MQSQKRVKVAISGGGIGGLTLALVLSKYAKETVEIDIYEAGSEFATVGAGITVWQRTRSILQTLGLGEALANKAISPPMIFRKGDEKDGGYDIQELVIPYGSVAIHRAEMLKLLTDELTAQGNSQFHPHFSKRLVSYEQDADGVTLQFADGSTAHADALVGADGLGSLTRKKMYEDLASQTANEAEAEDLRKCITPTWTGTYAYRSLIDREKLAAVAPENPALSQGLVWIGKDKHIVSYPISASIVNAVFFSTVPDGLGKTLDGPSVVDAQKEEIVELFKDWEQSTRILTDHVANPSRWAISHIRKLPTYVNGRVALLGDAAHAMSTHLGAGAGQAIEDAYILGRILAFSSGSDSVGLTQALKVYDEIRRPIAEDVVERSLVLGFLYEFKPEYLPSGVSATQLVSGDRAALAGLMEEVIRLWKFHWERIPEDDWQDAQKLLRAD